MVRPSQHCRKDEGLYTESTWLGKNSSCGETRAMGVGIKGVEEILEVFMTCQYQHDASNILPKFCLGYFG